MDKGILMIALLDLHRWWSCIIEIKENSKKQSTLYRQKALETDNE